ncbi:MAG TPA: hypothetical protein PKG96_06765 [Bacilli bacterium]|nr:hypothetical protein [Bacilli bacterium]
MNDAIAIRIYKEGTAESTTNRVDATPSAQEATTQEGKANKADGIRNSAVTAALISAAKQAAMQGVNKYAELSGNYNVTDNLSLVLEGATMVAMMFAGPVGWISAGSMMANKIVNYAVEIAKEKREINYLKDGLGTVQTYGNRGDY